MPIFQLSFDSADVPNDSMPRSVAAAAAAALIGRIERQTTALLLLLHAAKPASAIFLRLHYVAYFRRSRDAAHASAAYDFCGALAFVAV